VPLPSRGDRSLRKRVTAARLEALKGEAT